MSHLNVQFIQYIVLKISLEFVKKSTPPPPTEIPTDFTLLVYQIFYLYHHIHVINRWKCQMSLCHM